MARASMTSFNLDSAGFPVADPARLNACVRWGDDYQLLFTLPRGIEPPVAADRIGVVRAAATAAVLLDGAPPDPGRPLGYLHKSST